ncbi:DNA cytosine methyltransferase [Agrobacterium pusense]|uniref:DNA cytosine methyltransferase n=1 Tax=Agrobacterium pusense TaxID=648995 RepID=UPI00312C7D64
MVAHTLLGKENSSHGADLETYVAHTLKGEGFDASEDGTGRGTPIVPIAFNPKMGGDPTMGAGVIDDGTSYTLDAAGNSTAVAFDMRGREGGAQFEGPHETANIRAASGGSSKSYVAQEWAVRRLTPTECERLQGFPDNFTNVPWGKKDTSPDGPRYKALGNSFAVNVVRWIGQRIQKVEDICKELDRENME